MTAESRTGRGERILFVEKVFLKGRAASLRGVELFNVELLRDLLALNIEAWALCHPAWVPVLRDAGRLDRLRCLSVRGAALGSTARLLTAPPPRPDAVVVGNVGSGLIPVLRALRMRFPDVPQVLIAHRMPAPRFLRLLRHTIDKVVAVNGAIARSFLEAGYPRSEVYYGVTRADRFFPGARATDAAQRDAEFHVCLMGQLDNGWKGADTAIAAFQALPPELQRRVRLHLAAFRTPPKETLPDNIQIYSWMESARIPEFLRSMDAMLVLSRDEQEMRETFSQVMVQGMLSALPIICTPLPILTEKLDEGGGLIAASPAEIAAAIQRLAESPSLCAELGARAREVALSRYVWSTERFVQRFLPAAALPQPSPRDVS